MAKKAEELLQLLFPEYQIKVCVEERGFITKKNESKNHVQSTVQVYSTEDVQQKSAPAYTTVQSPMTSISQIAQTVKRQVNTYTPSKEDKKIVNKANDAFDGLSEELKKYWVGTENDINAICKAFQRPFIRGFDNVKPKNSILIIGSESRGKVYSVRCITELLKEKKVFRYAQIANMKMPDYAADSSNILFLSDLYKALNTNTESIIFEDIDKASLGQLEIIYQLLANGSYKLSKRYMVNSGSLVEATGVLNTELISEVTSNGKFFVMTSVLPQEKLISVLGNKIIKELGDIITLAPIEEGQVRKLVYTLFVNFSSKCEKNLHIKIEFEDSVIDAIGREYKAAKGVKGLSDFIDDNLYEALSEMKLQEVLWDEESAKITYNAGFCVELKGGEIVNVSHYLKNYDTMALEDVKTELSKVIGLAKVKEYVLNLETNYKVQQMREEKGFRKSGLSMHMIFTGNPGTGKTTIARIVSKYLKAIGILSSGHLCEVTRADLVGQYAGHTAVKTEQVINGAIGGILFIDEAYSLCRDKNDAFGLEAIDALVKGMEDNRNDLVVILAGYEDEMNAFLKANSGLKSRFPNIIRFEDYTVDEMYDIAKVTAESKGYKIDPSCESVLIEEFERHQIKGRNDSGNGRLVRNLIEKAVLNQSKRIVDDKTADLELLTVSDFGFDKIKEFNLEKQLSDIIGMEKVKDFVRTQYTLLRANKRRKEANISVDTTQSLNMIFAGNPGTGKTTIARVVADMLKSMGILKSGQLVETDKGGLVSGYVGQTAQKTEEVFRSALGGVLFIDEAYAITNDGSGFGQECIDTLVKLIEDYRGEIVVILAGYSKEMSDFLKSNSGLESRFPLRIDFPDYTSSELFAISKQMIAARGFVLASETDKIIEDQIKKLKLHATASSGNGRMVRNFVEDIIRRQSLRIATEDVAASDLTTILPSDVLPKESTVNVFDLESELSKVIGLDSVKKYIRSLNARLKLQDERKKAGLKTDTTQTLHMIFAGNPGTGKTMMARTVANVLYNMNVIQTNKLIETDRSGLVAGYVGQTAIKTHEVIEKALGGVLFIDEAYALAQGGENDFGQEAIDTLVKMMDDNRDRLVVILAGYSEDMKMFLHKNAGLQSRFANIIEFPDYTTDELMLIAKGLYSEQGYVLSDAGKVALREKIEAARKSKQFGNGRYVRNVFERSLNNQALRLNGNAEYTRETLVTITADDIKEA